MPVTANPSILPGAVPDLPDLTEAVVDFLRTEAAILRCALRRADVAAHPGTLQGTPPVAHETWLRCIAQVRDSGDSDAFALVTNLYWLHGRVRATVERGVDPSLGWRIAHQVRLLLAAHLTDRTETAVAAVRAAFKRALTTPTQ